MHELTPTVRSPLFSIRHSLGIFAETFIYLRRAKAELRLLNKLKMEWAQRVLHRFKIRFVVKGEVSQDPSMLFLGSHLSYLDIPLLLGTVSGLSFVAKQEVSFYPIIGSAAKLIETVFIKRESGDSRKAVRKSIHHALQRGRRIAIFPSGTTCMYEEIPWKKGSFEIAHEENVWVQPFRITYTPKRDVAYIGDDILLFHMFRLFRIPSVEAIIEFHPPVKITDPVQDAVKWQKWAQELNPPPVIQKLS